MMALFNFLRRHPRMPALEGINRGPLSVIQNHRLIAWIPIRRRTDPLWRTFIAGLTTLVLVQVLPLQAANTNVGTSGASFLKLDGGARPSALGDAFVGIADDINAIRYNPAGMSLLKDTQVSATRTQWFQDIDVNQGAIVYPSQIGAFGISALTMQIQDMDKRGADESYQGQFDSVDAAYNMSYSRMIVPKWSVGVTARYIKQEIDNTSASSWSGDIGTLKRLNSVPVTLGMAVRNIGQNIKFIDKSDPQPRTVDFGLGTSFLSRKLVLGVHAEKPRDNNYQYGVGTEWNQPFGRGLRASLRLGYRSSAQDPSGANGISYGCGMQIHRFEFDASTTSYGDLGNIFKFTLLFHL
jgi:hypothetical protein